MLLGTGLPFLVHNLARRRAIEVSGADCDPALRWGVFLLGLVFVLSILVPVLRDRRRAPSFGRCQAAIVSLAWLAVTGVVAARTLS